MTISLPISGGCMCKAVRYTISGPPVATRQCWCRTCQYFGAGSSTVNAVFRTPDVKLTGEVRYFTSIADSGNTLHRGFCPACGTPISSQSEARPHLLILRTGTLDDSALVRPAMEIWTGSAPKWACLDPGLPHVTGQPPPAA
jgi:hypothetical protein